MTQTQRKRPFDGPTTYQIRRALKMFCYRKFGLCLSLPRRPNPPLALRYRKRCLGRDAPSHRSTAFLKVFPSGLYLESASENGFYELGQGVLSKAAQLPHAYTHTMTQHGQWLLRSAGAAGLQIINFESPSAPFIQAEFDHGNSVKDAVLSTGGLWLAEQPERLRRVTIPTCFSN